MCWGTAAAGALGNGVRRGIFQPVPVGFGLVDFAGTCTASTECAAGQCVDPFATGTSSCWHEGVECVAAAGVIGPEGPAEWVGSGRYDGGELSVRVQYDPHGPYPCDSGWQLGTTWNGCGYDTSTRFVIEATGCTLSWESSGNTLATDRWQ
jgi:hypothetical protein